jgi:hypothetical protein
VPLFWTRKSLLIVPPGVVVRVTGSGEVVRLKSATDLMPRVISAPTKTHPARITHNTRLLYIGIMNNYSLEPNLRYPEAIKEIFKKKLNPKSNRHR